MRVVIILLYKSMYILDVILVFGCMWLLLLRKRHIVYSPDSSFVIQVFTWKKVGKLNKEQHNVERKSS